MFFPLITRPSRITSHTATLIDNIFVNNFFERSRSGLIFTDISDHLPVFSIHSNTTLLNRCRQDPVFIRNKNPDNIPSFVEKLKNVDWYKRFLELYSGIYNSSEGGMFLSGFSRGILINTRGHKLTPMTSPPIVLITHYRMTSYSTLVLPTGYELV